MNFKFDYYHNLEDVDSCLCNPDETPLFPLNPKNRQFALRFNDISEFSCDVYQFASSSVSIIPRPEYDYIEAKRLIHIEDIGWFQINSVVEHDDGVEKYKSVSCESLQTIFKNRGILVEDRVYCFYNAADPKDDHYDATKIDDIPSVIGQLNRQLGINLLAGLGTVDKPPTLSAPCEEWTIIYINKDLVFTRGSTLAESTGACRAFNSNTTFGYDWMVNDVSKAFKVLVLFDFLYKTIKIVKPEELDDTPKVLYSFSNFMKSINVTENADDIVTVLNCNGDNCDIRRANPAGTNYICDFSYFMDSTNKRWMSDALITKLNEWSGLCASKEAEYTTHYSDLTTAYASKVSKEVELQECSLRLQDLKNAQAKRGVLGGGTPGALCGTIVAENVKTVPTTIITAYKNPPNSFDTANGIYKYTDPNEVYKTGTPDSIIAANFDTSSASGGTATTHDTFWYYTDDNWKSYCKLTSKATIDTGSNTATYSCSGYQRFIPFRYPETNDAGTTTYKDSLQEWITKYETSVATLNADISTFTAQASAATAKLDEIADDCNILSFFSSNANAALLKELRCYWIEGEYCNDHIAVLDTTTEAEAMKLSKQLMTEGKQELAKVCKPQMSFSLESFDVIRQYEFKDQMNALELGGVVAVEKENGVWYEPRLLEMSFNLDNRDAFKLGFANSFAKNDDWGKTYADLISEASSTSRNVSANWQNLTSYSKNKETITSVIQDPLNSTLRAATANAVNQSFVVDQNGILGRKQKDDGTFENEQVRMINNTIIFTKDNWTTAEAALGKITVPVYNADGTPAKDGNGNPLTETKYGLIADTIIGKLLMGDKLHIGNSDDSVSITESGIVIKNGGNTVFQAKSDGTVIVGGTNANNLVTTSTTISGNMIKTGTITSQNGKTTLNLDQGAFTTPLFKVDVNGQITAPSGSIGAWQFDQAVAGGGLRFNISALGDGKTEVVSLGQSGIHYTHGTNNDNFAAPWRRIALLGQKSNDYTDERACRISHNDGYFYIQCGVVICATNRSNTPIYGTLPTSYTSVS